jgi:hypothetical protein
VEVDKKPNFIKFYKISRSLDSSSAASAGRKIALHHRQRDRGQYSFGVGKNDAKEEQGAHAALYPVCVFHALVSDERAVGITCFKRGISLRQVVPRQTEEFESCYELACRSCRQAPMTGPTTVNLGVAVFLRGLSYSSPKLPPRSSISTLLGGCHASLMGRTMSHV